MERQADAKLCKRAAQRTGRLAKGSSKTEENAVSGAAKLETIGNIAIFVASY